MSGFLEGLTDYGDAEFSAFLRGVFLASAGFDEQDLDRPVVGIADARSDYVTCHREFPALIEAVKRGVLEAGGLPVVFPTMALPEIFTAPTAMYLRNLMAMQVEESIRTQPMDGVVLVGGCDKTVPAQVMGALSAGRPFVQVVAGPMIPGSWRGQRVGACTDCRDIWSRHRAGELDRAEVAEAAAALAPTGGTCMVMGTASTMACLVEAMGVAVSGSATPAAPTGARLASGARAGRVIVEAIRDGRRPAGIVTRDALHNAAVVCAAIGGSTNAVVHLIAIARRAGIEFTLDDVAAAMRGVPVLVDCKPIGRGYLTDFDADGGVPALLAELADLLRLEAPTIDGRPLGARLRHRDRPLGTVRGLTDPVHPDGGVSVLRGSLAPEGAVIKTGAASPALLTHTGPAVVFDSLADLAARIDDPALPVTPSSVLVLRNAGPVAAGMPEAGALPIPRRLAAAGVRDMVRVSDARMSGTAFGTVVLHVSPEATRGGPLALVRDGDPITLDAGRGLLDLGVGDAELARRRAELAASETRKGLRGNDSRGNDSRGNDSRWARLHRRYVGQAHQGADLDVDADSDGSPARAGGR